MTIMGKEEIAKNKSFLHYIMFWFQIIISTSFRNSILLQTFYVRKMSNTFSTYNKSVADDFENLLSKIWK